MRTRNRLIGAGTSTIVAVAFVALAAPVAARDVVADPSVAVQRLRGPVTVIVVANPFRFPWVVTVNGETWSAPSSSIGTALPAPSFPPPAASMAAPPSGITGTSPSTLPAGLLELRTIATPNVAGSRKSTCHAVLDDIERCITVLETDVATTNKVDIVNAYESVCVAQLEFAALQARTDQILAGSAFDTEDHRRTSGARLLAFLKETRADPAQPSCSGTDSARRAVFGLRSTIATVASARAAIDRIRGFPTAAILDESQRIEDLIVAIARSDDTMTGRTTQAKAPASQKAVARKNRAVDRLMTMKSLLAPYQATAVYPAQAAAAIETLRKLRAEDLSNVDLSRFFVTVQQRCSGFFRRRGQTTITVMRSSNETNSIVIDCA
jgi:hypothetical protein